MNKDERKSFLELQIVWKDEEMFELKVTASNGRYFGTTEVYDTTDSLFSFAETLIAFPNNNKNLLHEAGIKDDYAFFSMNFYCIDNSGHIGVEIYLEDNVSTEFKPKEKDKVKLEIITEPSIIDNFQKELSRLATKQQGVAVLYGRDNSSYWS